MNIMEIKKEETIEVDIHKLNEYQAKYYLERMIAELDDNIKEIIVIHGYHSGKKLMEMVRFSLKSNRIERRLLSMNAGRTSLIIGSISH